MPRTRSALAPKKIFTWQNATLSLVFQYQVAFFKLCRPTRPLSQAFPSDRQHACSRLSLPALDWSFEEQAFHDSTPLHCLGGCNVVCVWVFTPLLLYWYFISNVIATFHPFVDRPDNGDVEPCSIQPKNKDERREGWMNTPDVPEWKARGALDWPRNRHPWPALSGSLHWCLVCVVLRPFLQLPFVSPSLFDGRLLLFVVLAGLLPQFATIVIRFHRTISQLNRVAFWSQILS